MPGEVLQMARINFRVPISEDSIITIKPKLSITSDGLRNNSPKERALQLNIMQILIELNLICRP